MKILRLRLIRAISLYQPISNELLQQYIDENKYINHWELIQDLVWYSNLKITNINLATNYFINLYRQYYSLLKMNYSLAEIIWLTFYTVLQQVYSINPNTAPILYNQYQSLPKIHPTDSFLKWLVYDTYLLVLGIYIALGLDCTPILEAKNRIPEQDRHWDPLAN